MNAGQTEASKYGKGAQSRLPGGGVATSSLDEDHDDVGYKIFGGYQIGRYFALEGGYFDLGGFGYKATTVPAGIQSGNLEARGLNLDAVGILPVTDWSIALV